MDEDWSFGFYSGELRFLTQPCRRTMHHFRSYGDNCDEDSRILENEMKLERKIDGIPVRKLYVSNIPKMVDRSELYRLFEKFGEVVRIYVSKKFDDDFFKKTTFGFVTYRSTEGAANALSQKNLSIGYKKLFVNAADSWHQPIVNPDGSVQFDASFGHNKSVNRQNESSDCNESEGGIEDDNLIGAVGGIGINSIPSAESEKCLISGLNDDCLEHIFSHLPLISKVTASKVCKRWHTVISNMCRNIESLNIKDHFPSTNKIKMETIVMILEIVGPYIKEIICNPLEDCVNKSFISIVGRYCRNLEVLDIANVEIAKRSFIFLAKQCPKLREVNFKACHDLTDKDLVYLFGRTNSKLETISFHELTGITGECLMHVQPPMKHISIKKCVYVKPELLMLALKKVRDTLTSLTLKHCLSSQFFDINGIVDAVPKLKNFNFSEVYPLVANSSLVSVGRFSELQSLELTNNCLVTDQSISAIVDGCKQLKYLKLGGKPKCGSLTSNGIASLANIKTLEELDVSRLDQVNDESMRYFSLVTPPPRIKKLVCFNCQNLSDKGAISILSSCTELEYFDVRNCVAITNETVKKALYALKKRVKNVSLKMLVYGSIISIQDEKSFSHPLLTLDFTDMTIMNAFYSEFICANDSDDLCVGDMGCECCVEHYEDFLTDSDVEEDLFDIYQSDYELESDDCQFFFNVL